MMGSVSTTTEPQAAVANAFGGYDRRTSVGMVRTTIEDGEHRIFRFTGHVVDWSVSFSQNVPLAVQWAAMESALDEIGYGR